MHSIRSVGTLLLLATGLHLGVASSAGAVALGGGVTGGAALGQGGSFVKLTVPFDPPNGNLNEVGNNTFQTPNLYVFDEDQNIVVDETIVVNVGASVSVGDIVASHYAFFDPLDGTTIQGFIDFDADIFGIITNTSNLAASDFLANNDVVYLNPGARGLEAGDSVSIDPNDPRRLLFDVSAGTPGDYVRVVTMESTVPEPGTALLVGMGLVGLASRRRRRNAKSPSTR